jgi:hypothetical protein
MKLVQTSVPDGAWHIDVGANLTACGMWLGGDKRGDREKAIASGAMLEQDSDRGHAVCVHCKKQRRRAK